MNSKTLSRIYISLAILFVIALIFGTIYDLPIAQALYSKDNTSARVVSFTGFILFIGMCTFYLGVLCRQLLSSGKGTPFKILIAVIFAYLYASTATLIGANILNDPLMEGVFPFRVTFTVSLLTGSPFYIPLFMLGMIANGNRYDKNVVKKTIKLVIIMTMVFLMSTYMNCMVIRPHFRLLQSSSEFEPWYHLNNKGKIFMSLSDLIASHPGSFFSGHAMYGILFLIFFPSFSLVFPKLIGKERLLMTIGGTLGLLLIFSRMITGDNYLSDISLGALSAIKMCFSFNAMSKRKGVVTKIRKRIFNTAH